MARWEGAADMALTRELAAMAGANLLRMKLRSVLTASGVAVGIGALVSMVSFSNGIQKTMAREFRELGLFRTIQVFPRTDDGESRGSAMGGQAQGVPLGPEALDEIARMPRVTAAYPQLSFNGEIVSATLRLSGRVQGLPAAVARRSPFDNLVRGDSFSADDAPEAIVSRSWLRRKLTSADRLVGRTVTVRTTGRGRILLGILDREMRRLGLPDQVAAGAVSLAGLWVERIWPSRATVRVVGEIDIPGGLAHRLGDVFLPLETAARIDHLPFGDPWQMLAMLSGPVQEGWQMLVVTVRNPRDIDGVRGEIEQMGYRVFSFLDEFREVRRAFLLLDGLIGALGAMALVIASMGIANTLVMAIVERRREIGVLKALGAEEREIRVLFLMESAAIGALGSLAGIALGYAVSRVLSWFLMNWMRAQRIPPMDLFALPVWGILGAIAFGIGVSVLAGLYPAARAARVDPVQALRTG